MHIKHRLIPTKFSLLYETDILMQGGGDGLCSQFMQVAILSLSEGKENFLGQVASELHL